jgi:hypothetical protein
MKENVGRKDRNMRRIVGPLLLLMGYRMWNAKRRRTLALATIVAGSMVSETAVTRVCPLNALLGIDTTRKDVPFIR